MSDKEIDNNLNFFLMMMIMQGKSGAVLTEFQRKDLVQTIVTNDEIIQNVEQEFKQLKIEGQRHTTNSKDMYYTRWRQRESRSRHDLASGV